MVEENETIPKLAADIRVTLMKWNGIYEYQVIDFSPKELKKHRKWESIRTDHKKKLKIQLAFQLKKIISLGTFKILK